MVYLMAYLDKKWLGSFWNWVCEIQQILYFKKVGIFEVKNVDKFSEEKNEKYLCNMDFWINIFEKKLLLQFSAD